jgi:hypothetical protein
MSYPFWRQWMVEVGVPSENDKGGKPKNPQMDSKDIIKRRIEKALRDEFGAGYSFDVTYDSDY